MRFVKIFELIALRSVVSTPGMIATEVPYDVGIEQALSQFNATQIPVQDVVAIARCILSLSRASCVKEITMPALADTWA